MLHACMQQPSDVTVALYQPILSVAEAKQKKELYCKHMIETFIEWKPLLTIPILYTALRIETLTSIILLNLKHYKLNAHKKLMIPHIELKLHTLEKKKKSVTEF